MEITTLIVLSSLTFLILRLLLLPFITSKDEKADLHVRIGKKAMEAAITTAASIASLLALSAALALGLIKYLQNLKSSTLDEAEDSLTLVRSANEFVNGVAGHFGLIVLGFCAFATIIWSYRRTKINGQNNLNSQIGGKMEELHDKYLADELEELPPTDAMDEIDAHILANLETLTELEENDGDPEQIVELREHLQELAELRHSIDLLRRAEPEVLANLENSAEQQTKSKWVTFFTSYGFFNTLGYGGKTLAIVGILSIVPASLVITGPIALNVADERKIALEDKVRNFSFVAETGKINQAYNELMADAGESAELTEEDEIVIDELAQSFESELLNSDTIVVAGQVASQGVGRLIGREKVRNGILTRATARSGSISLSSAPQSSATKSLIETEKLFAKSQSGKPVTPVGKMAAKKYREVAQKNPKLWANLKGKMKTYRASFSRRISPVRISGIAINQVIGDALSGVGGNKSLFFKQASKFGSDISADVARTYFDATYKKFLVEFNATGNLAQSARNSGKISKTAFSPRQVSGLRQMVSALPDQQSMVNHVQRRRPNLSSTNPSLNQARVQSAAKRVGARSIRGLEALSGFDDYFPGHAGQEFKTSKAAAARSLGIRGAPPKFSTATRAQLARSSRISARSGSYVRLRGFSRIGGVLIGRKPESKDAVKVDTFEWTIRGDKLWFKIATNDNEAKQLGPYSPAIASLALSYVADGRPTTVTMVDAHPLHDLKILTHPALIDTGLGCRARRLDQFADGATAEEAVLDELRKKETAFAMGEVQLYNLARNIQFVEISKTPTGKSIIKNQELSNLAIQADQGSKLTNDQLYGHAEARLVGTTTPLRITKKPAYFLQSTVKLVEACRQADTLYKFKACVQTNVDLSDENIESKYLDWVAPMVEFVPWSGVRERKYTVDDSFGFMKSNYPKTLGPLRFMVQLAISSPAHFADPEKGWYDEDNLAAFEYTDPEPWEFQETGILMNSTVLEGIKANSEKRNVYLDMIEFTYLQRFFRAALDGKMSESFPFEKLTRLHKETLPFVNDSAPTLRWHTRQLSLETILSEKLLTIKKSGPKINQCHALIGVLANASNSSDARGYYASWDKTCSGSALTGEVNDEISKLADEIANILNLRRELNISIDDFLAKKYRLSGCPVP